jgi:N-carbamoylputrescine amidase
VSKIKTSYIQGKSQGSIQANLEYYSLKIEEASKSGSKLIILPELFLWDYFPITENKKHFDLAISLDSKEVKHFQNLAKKLKVNLVLPVFEKSVDENFFNTALTLNESGEIISHYRKMHIPYDPGFYEKFYFTPGDKSFLVADTSIGKLGVLICFDQWFPEAARIMTLGGVQLITYPTAIGWDEQECRGLSQQALREDELNAWITIMRAHAIANGVYVIAVNRVGKEDHLTFWGNSFVCDPLGRILVQSGTEEDIQVCEIDFSKIETTRKIWTFLRDRRVDSYEPILKN